MKHPHASRLAHPILPCLALVVGIALSHQTLGAESATDTTRPQMDLSTFKPPRYPVSAIRAGEEGRVGVTGQCQIDGRLTEQHLTESSGHPDLDQAVLAVADSTRCKPAHDPVTGEPTVAALTYRYRFRLAELAPPAVHVDGALFQQLIAEARAANPDLALPDIGTPEGQAAAQRLLDARLASAPIPPAYPAESLAQREAGTAAVAFLCGKDGIIHASRIINPSGSPRLDAALSRIVPVGMACKPASTPDHGPLASWGFIAHRFIPPTAPPPT